MRGEAAVGGREAGRSVAHGEGEEPSPQEPVKRLLCNDSLLPRRFADNGECGPHSTPVLTLAHILVLTEPEYADVYSPSAANLFNAAFCGSVNSFSANVLANSGRSLNSRSGLNSVEVPPKTFCFSTVTVCLRMSAR